MPNNIGGPLRLGRMNDIAVQTKKEKRAEEKRSL